MGRNQELFHLETKTDDVLRIFVATLHLMLVVLITP